MARENADLQNDISQVSRERDEAKAKLAVHEAKQASIDQQHTEFNKQLLTKMKCHWTEKAKAGNLWFIICWSWVLGLLRYALYLVDNDFEYEFDWFHVLYYLAYILAIGFWDRRRCLRNGRQPYFWPVPTKYSYEYVKTLQWSHPDDRPEHWKVSENKYEANYAYFDYWVKGPKGTIKLQTKRIVSVELLVQLISNGRIMSLANEFDVVDERMRQTAAAFKCINISKNLFIDQDVVENTIMVALGCWKRNLRRRFW
jgi:hypothetical protein